MERELTPEQEAIIEKATKLLAVQGRTEAETEAYTSKAMELLAAHNLDISAMERKSGAGPAKRADKTEGVALYKWQRDVWEHVAVLNFCRHFAKRGLRAGSHYQHRLVGRAENVLATKLMAEYVCGAIERLAREWAADQGHHMFAKPSIAYREGMATRVVERLDQIRREQVAESERQKREEEQRARNPAYASSGTAMVLVDVMKNEYDLNYDYLMGYEPGTTTKRRLEREARQIAAQKAADEAWEKEQQWRRDNPVEAAERDAKAAKEYAEEMAKYAKQMKRRRSVSTYRAPKSEQVRHHSYYEGVRAGDKIGLNKQVEGEGRNKLG